MTSAKFFLKSGGFMGITLGMLLLSNSMSVPTETDSLQPPPGMVFIQGGEFLMGKAEEGDHSPVHQVVMNSFFMDQYEVTNAQYFEFCQQTQRHLPEFWGMAEFNSGPDFPNHPVVGVSWYDASDYANWIGKRLPTEAEWEYAARGGLAGQNFPNGNSIDSTGANMSIKGRRKGTRPVGSYAPNGYGLYDMAGNVVEWVADYYAEDYYQQSPERNPGGPTAGKFKVIRGGGWHSGPYCNRVYVRNALPPNWVDFNVGFRCFRALKEKQ